MRIFAPICGLGFGQVVSSFDANQADAVVEQIAQWLEAAINDIKILNGYNYDLTAHRPSQLDLAVDQMAEGLICITQSNAEEDVLSKTSRIWQQPFMLSFVVYDTKDVSLDAKLNGIRSDIEKRIGIENANHIKGKRCSGLADDIMLKPPQYFDTERATGMIIPVIIRYSTALNDPYVSG